MNSDWKQERNRAGARTRAPIRLPLWIHGIAILVALAFVISSSLWLFRTVRQTASAFNMSEPEFGSISEPAPGAAVTVNESNDDNSNTQSPIISADALKPWQGKERITILLLGIDQRCEEEGPTHTDTLMVATIDPVNKSAAVLSLPRDLWVNIPGFGVDRINQAFYLGQVHEYPGGGQALAMETVEAVLGIPIDYYLAINFDAFIQFVDQIGGIDIDVPEPIDDTAYPDRCYGYDPFHIAAGEQHLDGETALKYARTRATFGGDVDRATRQQAVIMAVRDRITRLDLAPQLLQQAPTMWQTLQDNVRTDLSLDKAAQLGSLAQEIPRDNIRMAVINYDYVYNETTPDGKQVLVPVSDKIRDLRDELFAPPPAPTPEIEALPGLIAEENARVALHNGTAVFGLAGATQDYLQQFNINVTNVGNADTATYRTSQIIDYGSHPNTVQYLIQLMDIPPLNVSSGNSPDGDFDVLVIIGNDWRVPEPKNN